MPRPEPGGRHEAAELYHVCEQQPDDARMRRRALHLTAILFLFVTHPINSGARPA